MLSKLSGEQLDQEGLALLLVLLCYAFSLRIRRMHNPLSMHSHRTTPHSVPGLGLSTPGSTRNKEDDNEAMNNNGSGNEEDGDYVSAHHECSSHLPGSSQDSAQDSFLRQLGRTHRHVRAALLRQSAMISAQAALQPHLQQAVPTQDAGNRHMQHGILSVPVMGKLAQADSSANQYKEHGAHGLVSGDFFVASSSSKHNSKHNNDNNNNKNNNNKNNNDSSSSVATGVDIALFYESLQREALLTHNATVAIAALHALSTLAESTKLRLRSAAIAWKLMTAVYTEQLVFNNRENGKGTGSSPRIQAALLLCGKVGLDIMSGQLSVFVDECPIAQKKWAELRTLSMQSRHHLAPITLLKSALNYDIGGSGTGNSSVLAQY